MRINLIHIFVILIVNLLVNSRRIMMMIAQSNVSKVLSEIVLRFAVYLCLWSLRFINGNKSQQINYRYLESLLTYLQAIYVNALPSFLTNPYNRVSYLLYWNFLRLHHLTKEESLQIVPIFHVCTNIWKNSSFWCLLFPFFISS